MVICILNSKDLEDIENKIVFTERQKRIIKYRMLDYSIVMMADLESCATSTISNEIAKIGKKMRKVL